MKGIKGFQKGNKLGRFVKGNIPWDKGKSLSKEHKSNLSKSHKGLNTWMNGKKLSEETRKKQSEARFKRRIELGYINSLESRKKMSASKQDIPLDEWKEFVSFEPYTIDFNKQFKLAIKQRDGFMCLKCGMRDEDAKQLFKKCLHVHHIDYNKKNTIKENCCILCVRCNVESNKNRTSWTKFFQSLLAERYGYKYDAEGNIILNLQEVIK